MIEVGVLGLDTSHPEKFASVLADRDDATVAAVWDGGAVRDDGYVDSFADDHGAALYADPTAMTDAVDAAMVLTVDWSSHRPLAVPFLEAGVPTLIDKPIAGSAVDVAAIEAAAGRGGAPLFGGSAVPFHPAVTDLGEVDAETVFCSGFGDPFYYGAHLIDTVCVLVDADWARIEPLDGDGRVAAVRFEDGSTVTFDFDGSESDGTFAFLSVGDRTDAVTVQSTPAELDRMYGPFLDGFVAAARGERDERRRLTDGARLLLGIQAAFENGRTLRTGAVGGRAATVMDSAAFLDGYEPYY